MLTVAIQTRRETRAEPGLQRGCVLHQGAIEDDHRGGHLGDAGNLHFPLRVEGIKDET